ncbi:Blue copper protein [Morella rubra]|uniref:Blue copper protein n=1 Tax=Morella rubra TaxID=262757 RepID=A0A6A1UHT2_9ROSI|nr:Blue copper protein [Morella rubra]KAB1199398.1 Blue copper protein [Morella rubra]
MATRRNVALLFVVLAAAGEMLHGAEGATEYVVGDDSVWAIPSDSNFYASWASEHTFSVGDSLVFNFDSGSHDVATVTQSSFESCDTSNSVTVSSSGPFTFVLNSTGKYYFICTFPMHCSSGQKLAISVKASSGSPPKSSTPPSGSQVPSTSAGSTQRSPPPPAGAASSLAATFSFVLMTVALSIFYLS